MKLTEVVSDGLTVNLNHMDVDLAREIQTRLTDLGCLDPPSDGVFGPVSRLGLREFATRAGVGSDGIVDAGVARALLNSNADDLFPVSLGDDFASRTIKYFQHNGFWFARIPNFQTIAYVEGANEDGSPNNDAFNEFNDRRIVIAIEGNRPKLLFNVLATTEPGRAFTLDPVNSKGAARIAFGQFKAWIVGTHKAGKPSAHEALVQAAPLPVHRDLDQNGIRPGDKVDVGMFGINQHSGFNADAKNIGNASAGCLVSRSHTDHKAFMTMVKTDPRFNASRGYRFMTTIIAGEDLQRQTG
jgi:peptidoglycan hydrolase-like protein with peptidoglycan-binding domain